MSPAAGVPGNLIVMGQILVPYGVQGWVKVKPHTERADALLGYSPWWVKPMRAMQWREMKCVAGRVHGGALVVQIEGIDTREAALGFKLADVAVAREALPPTKPKEIYCVDLIGLRVTNREGVELGEVDNVVDHGAHPLLHVARAGGGASRLIPYVPSVVDGVDLAARRIDVDWGEEW